MGRVFFFFRMDSFYKKLFLLTNNRCNSNSNKRINALRISLLSIINRAKIFPNLNWNSPIKWITILKFHLFRKFAPNRTRKRRCQVRRRSIVLRFLFLSFQRSSAFWIRKRSIRHSSKNIRNCEWNIRPWSIRSHRFVQIVQSVFRWNRSFSTVWRSSSTGGTSSRTTIDVPMENSLTLSRSVAPTDRSDEMFIRRYARETSNDDRTHRNAIGISDWFRSKSNEIVSFVSFDANSLRFV